MSNTQTLVDAPHKDLRRARAASLSLTVPAAVDGVKAQQVRRGRRIAGRLVDVHEPEVLAPPAGAQRETAHSAEAVDRDTAAVS